MQNSRFLRTSVCALALFTANTAVADVTAGDVWADWQEFLSLYGDDGVTYTVDDQGNTITVSDVEIVSEVEGDDVTVTADIGDILFVDQGDGTVKITMADSFPMVTKGDDSTIVTMTVTQSGVEIIASGTPEVTNYSVTADQYGFSVDEIKDAGGAPDGDIRMIANNVTGEYIVTEGADGSQSIDYTANIGAMDILMDLTDPIEDTVILISGKINNLNAVANAVVPADADFDMPETLFAAGMAANGSYTYDSMNYLIDFKSFGDQLQGTVSTGAGSFNGGIAKTAFDYVGSVSDVKLDLTSIPDFPFPVSLSLSEYGFGMNMPLAKTEEPSDFGLMINLQDLAVNDEIWMLGDPAGQLPHDPVSLNLDLTGTAKMFYDLLDPEQAEAMAMAPVPGELHSLSLNNLLINALGAEVTGGGAFTFDNTDLATFNGMPRPLGDVTVKVSGANKLIDTLVGMGMLPEEDAMMGRMMMGMFAKAVGDDQLQTTLEVNKEGHVIANGQRIQ